MKNIDKYWEEIESIVDYGFIPKCVKDGGNILNTLCNLAYSKGYKANELHTGFGHFLKWLKEDDENGDTDE